MKPGQYTIRGKRADGTEGPVDVLNLKEKSFRALIFDILVNRLNAHFGTKVDVPPEVKDVPYHEEGAPIDRPTTNVTVRPLTARAASGDPDNPTGEPARKRGRPRFNP